MALPTNYYVDPASGTDAAGKGAIGDPYASLQYALDDIGTTHGQGASGDQVNLKAGTKDTLAASLDLTTYGAPTADKPLMFRGCDSVESDGGQAEVDCGGYAFIDAATTSYVTIADLEIHNSTATQMIRLDNYCMLFNCELHDCTGNAMRLDVYNQVAGCNIHDIGAVGVFVGAGTQTYGCYFKNGTKSFTQAIYASGPAQHISHNILSLSGGSDGLFLGNTGFMGFNSLLCSSSSSNKGITLISNAKNGTWILNNIVEGFTVGFDGNSNTRPFFMHNNAAYNNGTNYGSLGDQYSKLPNTTVGEDNESLSGTPFDKDAGGDTFANRFAYFAPTTEGNVRGGAYPGGNLDKGAVQHVAAGGTTNIIIPRPRRTM